MSHTPTSSPENLRSHNRIDTIRQCTVSGINGVFDLVDFAGEAAATVANRTAGFSLKVGRALFDRNR